MANHMNLNIGNILFFLLWIAAQPVISQKSWTGGGNGISWFDERNWSPSGVPTQNDVVTIDDPTAFIEINPNSVLDPAFAKALYIDDMQEIALFRDRVLSIKTQGNENISLHIKKGTFGNCDDVFIEGATVDGIKLEGNSTLGVDTDA
ncbi:MAG: hypothetical protein ACJA01_002643 [Saprospiraceae bacterium]|jgi:hypothetical protein